MYGPFWCFIAFLILCFSVEFAIILIRYWFTIDISKWSLMESNFKYCSCLMVYGSCFTIQLKAISVLGFYFDNKGIVSSTQATQCMVSGNVQVISLLLQCRRVMAYVGSTNILWLSFGVGTLCFLGLSWI